MNCSLRDSARLGEDLDGKCLRKTHSKTASHSVDDSEGGTFLSGVLVDFVC